MKTLDVKGRKEAMSLGEALYKLLEIFMEIDAGIEKE